MASWTVLVMVTLVLVSGAEASMGEVPLDGNDLVAREAAGAAVAAAVVDGGGGERPEDGAAVDGLWDCNSGFSVER